MWVTAVRQSDTCDAFTVLGKKQLFFHHTLQGCLSENEMHFTPSGPGHSVVLTLTVGCPIFRCQD